MLCSGVISEVEGGECDVGEGREGEGGHVRRMRRYGEREWGRRVGGVRGNREGRFGIGGRCKGRGRKGWGEHPRKREGWGRKGRGKGGEGWGKEFVC